MQHALAASFLSILFGFLVAFRDNDIVQITNFLLAGLFSAVALYLYRVEDLIEPSLPRFLLIPFKVAKNSLQSLPLLTSAQTWSSSTLDRAATSAIFRGILITIPVVIVLLVLLLNADPIFGTLTGRILENIGERIVYSLVVFISLVILGFSTMREKSSDEKKLEQKSVAHRIYEIAIITGSVAGLFAIFMAVQFKYLFSVVNLSDLKYLSIDITTYSQYVRQGFFELLAASTIASIIVVYAIRFIPHFTGRNKTVSQVVSSILTIETGLLLLSAFKRLSLYADDHGLTRARVFGFIFLIWVASMLVLLFIRIFKQLSPKKVLYASLASALVAVFLINVINIDKLIATVYKPTVNREVDYFYIANLSADSYESWGGIIKAMEKETVILEKKESLVPDDARRLNFAQWTLGRVKSNIDYLNGKYEKEKKWQKFNMAEFSAYQWIKNNKDQVHQADSLVNRLYAVQNKMNQELYQNAPMDRSSAPPLMEVQH